MGDIFALMKGDMLMMIIEYMLVLLIGDINNWRYIRIDEWIYVHVDHWRCKYLEIY
jgi:hypothetical protein